MSGVLAKRKIIRTYSKMNRNEINGSNHKKRRLSDDISNKYDGMFKKIINDDIILKRKFDPDLFIDGDIGQTLICPICLYICDSPVYTGCISNHFGCRNCLFGLMKSNINKPHTCPVCRQQINKKTLGKPNRLGGNIINISKMKCLHHNICPWIGKHSEFSLHVDVCQYNEYACKNCSKHVMKNDFNSHIRKYKCAVQCNYCDAIYPRNCVGGHEMTCEFKSIKCGNYSHGCKVTNLNQKNISHHMNYVCEYRMIKCEYGCGMMLRLNTLQQHNINYIKQHMNHIKKIKDKYSKIEELHNIIKNKTKELGVHEWNITNKCIEYCNTLSDNDFCDTSDKSDDDDDDDTEGVSNSDVSDENSTDSDDENDNDSDMDSDPHLEYIHNINDDNDD